MVARYLGYFPFFCAHTYFSPSVVLQKAFLSTTSDLHLIINAVGKDRLGIVSDVTGMVIAAGGNVGDSQAAKLGSHFSLMMEVSLPREKLDTLKEQIESMPNMNAALYEDEVQDAAQTPQIGCTFGKRKIGLLICHNIFDG